MNTQNKKRKKSIDGHFSELVNLNFFTENNQKFYRYNTIHGEGNSISNISYNKIGSMIKPILNDNFILDSKKNIISCNGNAKIIDVHNFLINKKRYCPFFPSYPGISVGACIANGVHGINSKDGIFNDYVSEITIFNPNFGYKVLSKSKNKKLFRLTKNGFGLTGIITKIKLKVFNLNHSKYKIKIINKDDLFKSYQLIKRSNCEINQNSFYVDYKTKNLFVGRIITGKKINDKKIKLTKLKLSKIPNIRLKFFENEFIKKILFQTNFFIEKFKYFFKKEIDINNLLFTSNYNTAYFLFQSRKFIEYQNIIPEKNIEKYLFDFKNLLIKYKPNITLLHLKIFNKKGDGYEFTQKGLAITIHVICDKNFNQFYDKILKLDLKFNCKINLYKNSLINKKIIKMFYHSHTKKFLKDISLINKKLSFVNNLFNNQY